MEKKTLVQRLLSRIPAVEYYPTRHKKAAKRKARYIFISEQFFEHKDQVTGVVSVKRIGFTYRKA